MHDLMHSLIEADEARYNAMIGADERELERLLHEDLVYTHSSARVDRRPTYMDGILSRRVRYLSREILQREAVMADTCGLLFGRVVMQVNSNGNERRLDVLFTNTWVHGSQGWRMLAWASTPIANP